TSGGGVSIPWRTFRYSHLPVALVLHGEIAVGDRAAAASVENAHLTTYVEPAGRLLNYYSFQVRHWMQRSLPLRLPAGAQLLAARVDGRWLARPVLYEAPVDAGSAPFRPRSRADGRSRGASVVELPTALGAGSLCFEVVYALDYPPGKLWAHVNAPAPVLPVAAVA